MGEYRSIEKHSRVLQQGPFIVRFASALGEGWKDDDAFTEFATLDDARTEARCLLALGNHVQIIDKVTRWVAELS